MVPALSDSEGQRLLVHNNANSRSQQSSYVLRSSYVDTHIFNVLYNDSKD